MSKRENSQKRLFFFFFLLSVRKQNTILIALKEHSLILVFILNAFSRNANKTQQMVKTSKCEQANDKIRIPLNALH